MGGRQGMNNLDLIIKNIDEIKKDMREIRKDIKDINKFKWNMLGILTFLVFAIPYFKDDFFNPVKGKAEIPANENGQGHHHKSGK